ncbi:unnamed protein product [Didymodactylos carnosus]|uniref:Uncharacterized protein n=1 Tax=Didymodactylos carnosus TaxID=1234261 RepID=A0A815I8K2_9BILA|nr:unnamed protein product [Didymodactylos carnosus]CAF1364569.1 unnamed protein product [Didymodactylos carnosus]CAF4139176.1 unnamed protein product [Didymodactylos carnosus]CAF4245858.1 unnamed protein product [Didymodactylos carnosus]
MRLKTLHHQRPISKAEGIVITGNKIDLINDIKTKYHHKIDSMNNDGTKQNTNRSQKHFEQIRQNLASDTSTASYQAIEATYLKHGIIIHILKTTPMVKVTNQNTSSILTSNTKPTFRRKAFLCKKQNCDLQHRSINILQYSMNDETNSESNHAKSLTELETATSIMADDLDKNLILNVSYPVDQGQHSSFDIHSSSIITNEKSEIVEDDRSQLLLLRAQSSVQQDKDEPTKHFTNIKFNEESVQSLSPKQQQQVKEDPDLVYMYNLLKKHTGNSVTDAIRRRAGLRNTFAVHRRLSQNLASGEESNNKSHYNKVLIPYTHSNIDFCPTPTITKLQRRNYDHEHHHQMNVNEYKSFSNITQKKIEKDIVKHASRIRTTQSKEYYSFGSSNNRLASSYTNTNTDSHKRINFNQHQNIKQKTTIHQPSTPISLVSKTITMHYISKK